MATGSAATTTTDANQAETDRLVPLEEDKLDKKKTPSSVERGCTDVFCALLFVIALVGYGYILNYARTKGNIANFSGMPNYNDTLCGVSEGAKDKPWLFFCLDHSGATHLRADAGGICVSKCPENDKTIDTCPTDKSWVAPNGTKIQATVKADGNLEVPKGSTEKWFTQKVTSYPTHPFAGMMCMPEDTTVLTEVLRSMKDNQAAQFGLEVHEMGQAWAPIATAAVLSILLALAYLFLMKFAAQCMIWSGLILGVIVCAGGGLYLLSSASSSGEGKKQGGLIIPGNVVVDGILGVVGCAFAVFLLFVAFAARKAIGFSSACIKSACECVISKPTLFFQPLIALVLDAVIFYYMFVNLIYLISCGLRFKHRELGEGEIKLATDFNFEPQELLFIFLYLIISNWIVEFCDAAWRFVVSYVTQVWFFRGKALLKGEDSEPVSCCPTGKAYALALTLHLGTLAQGSFVISFLRPARILMNIVTAVAHDRDAIGKCFGVLCLPCVTCHRSWLQPMHKNAYMDVALNGHGFCTSATHALAILKSQSSQFAALSTATTLFKQSGLAGIMAIAFTVTNARINMSPSYSNPESRYYLAYPTLVCFVSAIISAIVAGPILLLVTDVSDSILFCSAVGGLRDNDPEGSADPEFLTLISHTKESAEKVVMGEDEEGTFVSLLGGAQVSAYHGDKPPTV